MLPFKGSLFLERQPVWASFQVFWERDPPIFLLESGNSKISGKQQNLWETAKSHFERDSNRKISSSLSSKRGPYRLPFQEKAAIERQHIT